MDQDAGKKTSVTHRSRGEIAVILEIMQKSSLGTRCEIAMR